MKRCLRRHRGPGTEEGHAEASRARDRLVRGADRRGVRQDLREGKIVRQISGFTRAVDISGYIFCRLKDGQEVLHPEEAYVIRPTTILIQGVKFLPIFSTMEKCGRFMAEAFGPDYERACLPVVIDNGLLAFLACLRVLQKSPWIPVARPRARYAGRRSSRKERRHESPRAHGDHQRTPDPLGRLPVQRGRDAGCPGWLQPGRWRQPAASVLSTRPS